MSGDKSIFSKDRILVSDNSYNNESEKGSRKTTHMSSPSEVAQRMKLARLTVINDDDNNDIEGTPDERQLGSNMTIGQKKISYTMTDIKKM